nr:hypothetical protein [Mesotoga sp. Brook.08.YT.4.2.5.1]
METARALAGLRGRDYIIPDDVKEVLQIFSLTEL